MDSHACGQRRNHVHDHRGRVDSQAARNVEAHPRHGHPFLAHHGAVPEGDVDVGRALPVGEPPGAADGLFKRGTYSRVQAVQRGPQRLGRNPRVRLLHAVERAGRSRRGRRSRAGGRP